MSSRSPRTVVTFPIVLRELTVLRVADVTPGMRRITLGGEQLGAFRRDGLDLPALRTEGFDDHVKFFFPAEGEDRPVLPRQRVGGLEWPRDRRPIARDYTPRRYDPDAGEIDFDFVLHAGGVAAAWAARARPGMPAWIAGPKMSLGHPEGVDRLLILGDETALPAIGRWLEEMPEGTRADVFVEVSDRAHRQDLPTKADATITWLLRDGAASPLERAVRELEWPPGRVFVWAAGEAGALKGIRRHLVADRGVPRELLDFTGYWRRADPGEDDDAHRRLHELTDLAPGFAVRAAVTLGLVDLVHAGVARVADLAARLQADPDALAVLCDYLVAIGVFRADGGYRLTAVGEELVEDHTAEELHLDGAVAALDLALSALVETVRTGRPGYRTPAGVPLGRAVATDPRLAASARDQVEEMARWVAPGVVTAHDWAAEPAVTAAGNGAGTIVNALVRAFPGLKLRVAAPPSALAVLRERILDPEALATVDLLPQAGPVPPADGGTLLLAHALHWLPDEDAVQLLSEARGGRIVLVEHVRSADPEDLEYDLRLRCAFGSGLRTEARVGELAERAGLRVARVRDVGWEHRLWVLG